MITELLIGLGGIASGAIGRHYYTPAVKAVSELIPEKRCVVQFVNGVEHHSHCGHFPDPPSPTEIPPGSIVKDSSHYIR